MASIADIRAKYPQYADLSDDALAHGFHDKFYADMPFSQFAQKVGYEIPTVGPDGRTLTGVEKDAYLRDKKAQQQPDSPVGAVLGNIVGGAEQYGAKAVAGLRGLYDTVTGKGADQATQDIRRITASAPGYNPKDNLTGASALADEAMRHPANPLNWPGVVASGVGKGASYVANKLGAAPEASQAIEQGISEAGPLAVGFAIPKGKPSVMPETAPGEIAPNFVAPPRGSPADTTTRLSNFGIQMRPSDVAQLTPGKIPSLRGRALEAAVGSANAAREFSMKNAAPIQQGAAADVGIDISRTGGVFTKDDIAAARKAPNAVYQEVSQAPGAPVDVSGQLANIPTRGLSDEASTYVNKLRGDYAVVGDSADAVRDVLTLRDRASQYMSSDKPDFKERARAARQTADAIENVLMSRASEASDGTLPARFQKARVQLAKLHTVEDSLKGGIVDAQKVLADREYGVKLTGNLDTIADTAAHVPNVVRHPQSYANAQQMNAPHGIVDALQGLVRNIGGRSILNGPYQTAIGKVRLQPGPEVITDASRLLSAPGVTAREAVAEGLSSADRSARPWGDASVAPESRMLPAPGNTVGGSNYSPVAVKQQALADAIRMSAGEQRAALSHPAGPDLSGPRLRPEMTAETPPAFASTESYNPPIDVTLAKVMASSPQMSAIAKALIAKRNKLPGRTSPAKLFQDEALALEPADTSPAAQSAAAARARGQKFEEALLGRKQRK